MIQFKTLQKIQNVFLLPLLVQLLLFFANAHASQKAANDNKTGGIPLRFGVDYFYPTSDSRDIRTINLNGYYPIKNLTAINLSFHGGVTATWAKGDIRQLEGELSEGTLREVTYENNAVGIGPVILADLQLWSDNKFSIHIEGSGGILFYDKEFPAGGDHYNFMWRGGPALHFTIAKGRSIGLGYQWMHVSNGQGFGSKNPSYDAQGVSLQVTFVF